MWRYIIFFSYSSQDCSIGSISAWYRGRPRFKSRQGQEFFSENKLLDCSNLITNIFYFLFRPSYPPPQDPWDFLSVGNFLLDGWLNPSHILSLLWTRWGNSLVVSNVRANLCSFCSQTNFKKAWTYYCYWNQKKIKQHYKYLSVGYQTAKDEQLFWKPF